MKTWLIALSMAVAGAGMGFAPSDAEARRLGGGKAAGMQRQAPPPKPADTTPATPAAQPGVNAPVAGAAAAGGTAAAAAGSRSWLGPVAGIAAGLGIAALMSHLGMGAAFANLLTMLLLAAVAFFVLRWALRRFAGNGAGAAPRMAGAAAGAGAGAWTPPVETTPGARASTRSPDVLAGLDPGGGTFGAAPAAAGSQAPEGFDAEGFLRIAKMIFIRLQAANDAGQVDDLRKFTTPELFASLRLDLQERGDQAQQTDVLQLDAEVVDTAREDGQWVVSVRFHGLVREASEAAAEPFDELWHLVKPVDDSREWAIAGITPQS